MIKRLAAASAVVTTAVVVGLVTPAFALLWIWIGPHATFEACDAERIEFSNTYITQACQYRDLTGTLNDGWYFRYRAEF
jgi:hypothetical protein